MYLRSLINSSTRSCTAALNCPDILELQDGDFAVIGADMTKTADQLPAGSGCGPEERIVRVPRMVMLQVRGKIGDGD